MSLFGKKKWEKAYKERVKLANELSEGITSACYTFVATAAAAGAGGPSFEQGALTFHVFTAGQELLVSVPARRINGQDIQITGQPGFRALAEV